MIAETITLTLKVGQAEAARIGEQLYGEKLARIHWANFTHRFTARPDPLPK